MSDGPTSPFAALIVPIPRPDGPTNPPPGFEPHPEHPIVLPPGGGPTPPPDAHPEHPIVLPPQGPPPLVIWGPGDPRPTLPIAGFLPDGTFPGDKPDNPAPGAPKFEWRTGWTEEHGWVVVGVPNFPHPTPSKKK
jgi:hypothetical protein